MSLFNEDQLTKMYAADESLKKCKNFWAEAVNHQKKAIKHYEDFEKEMDLALKKVKEGTEQSKIALKEYKSKVEPEIKKFLTNRSPT